MTSIENAREYWNRHATRDPLWAALSDRSKTERRWDLPSFMQTGEREMALLFREISGLKLAVNPGRAVDFGCGVGRLAQALARRFQSVVGLDVSSEMIRLAKRVNKYGDRVAYHVNDGSLRNTLQASSVDFVYSTLVLQHMHPDESAAYLAELVSGLRPGGLLVFQLPATKVEAPRGPIPMPEPAYRATIDITRPIPAQVDASSSVMLSIEIVNAANTTWIQREVGAIRAGNHWLDIHGGMLVQDDGRALLPEMCRPGERCTIELQIRAPAPPGNYLLEIDVVHEGIAWFADRGSAAVRLPVEICEHARTEASDKASPAGPPEAAAIPLTLPDYSDVAVDDLLPAPGVTGDLSDFPMHGIPREQVARIIAASGGEVVHVVDDDHAKPEWNGYKYFVRRPSA
jgi:SAM-dependent methyltransferase